MMKVFVKKNNYIWAVYSNMPHKQLHDLVERWYIVCFLHLVFQIFLSLSLIPSYAFFFCSFHSFLPYFPLLSLLHSQSPFLLYRCLNICLPLQVEIYLTLKGLQCDQTALSSLTEGQILTTKPCLCFDQYETTVRVHSTEVCLLLHSINESVP